MELGVVGTSWAGGGSDMSERGCRWERSCLAEVELGLSWDGGGSSFGELGSS